MTPTQEKPRTQGTTRRSLLRMAVGAVIAGASAAAYARWVEPTWIEVVERNLPVPHLPPAWESARVALIADLHHGASVPLEYLAVALARVADLRPDLVAVAGDFVTGGRPEAGEAVAELVGRLSPPLGTVACLGNHDYGVVYPVPDAPALPVAGALTRRGVRVLRNQAACLTRGGEDLWVAGVEDLWAGRLRPADAVRDIPRGAASIMLCHNPDAAEGLEAAGCGAILSGHTHGGQVHIPLLGPPILPVRNRGRYRGMHRVGRARLYINRGLGWLLKVRLACRPEITVLALCRAPDEDEARASAPGANGAG